MIISCVLVELKIVFNEPGRKINYWVQLKVYSSYSEYVFETFVIN